MNDNGRRHAPAAPYPIDAAHDTDVPRRIRATPIQRAGRLLAEALSAARETEEADRAFADMLVLVAARAQARLLERDEQAA